MATTQQGTLPVFQPYATAQGFLADRDMDRLIEEHLPQLGEGKLGPGTTNSQVRRSQVVMLGSEPKHAWLYDRVWAAVQECNRQFFCVDLAGVEANIQLARYDSSDRGFYDWHTDFAGLRPLRKLSVSIQLSNAQDYDGGDLELMFASQPQRMERARRADRISELHVAPRDARDARHALQPRCLGARRSLALTRRVGRRRRSSFTRGRRRDERRSDRA